MEIRRLESRLRSSGLAFIVFGVWSIVKIIMMITMSPIAEIAEIEGAEELKGKIMLFLILAVLFFTGIEIIFRLFVGLSAMGEAKGKRKRIIYLIFAFIYLAYYGVNVVYSIIYMMSLVSGSGFYSFISSLILDSTTVFMLIMIITSSIKLRKLRRTTPAACEKTIKA